MSFENLRDYLGFSRRNSRAKKCTNRILDYFMLLTDFLARMSGFELVVHIFPVAPHQTINYRNNAC
jgi:hypothetical protein